jgi:uncharacterized membrane protein
MFWSNSGHMGLMGLWWIVILAAIAAAIWFGAAASRGRHGQETSAEHRLKERYADGEIDRATFERTLADLRK